MLDEDTGEYQKCLYVPQPQEEDGEQQHQQQHLVQEDQHEEQQIQVSEEPVVSVGGEQQ